MNTVRRKVSKPVPKRVRQIGGALSATSELAISNYFSKMVNATVLFVPSQVSLSATQRTKLQKWAQQTTGLALALME